MTGGVIYAWESIMPLTPALNFQSAICFSASVTFLSLVLEISIMYVWTYLVDIVISGDE